MNDLARARVSRRARGGWGASAAAVAIVAALGGATAGCRHMNGTWSDRDPNGPGGYDARPHNLSGPGVEPSGVGHYGSQYGK